MIAIPTVLVLGAGASIDYGFPSGRILLTSLLSSLKNESNPYFKLLRECGFDSALIHEFREALDFSGQPSVDAFLEGRRKYIDLGKSAIALDLIPAETEGRLRRDTNNFRWYEYLFVRLNAAPDEFKANRLSVITFNYDRSLEHFLYLALKNSHELPDEKCADLLSSVPIVHLHGHLGELPYLTGRGREYTPNMNPQILRECSRTIKVIHESAETDPEFQKARQMLAQADVICFLGFGYHKTNVERLGFSHIPNIQTKRLIGSAFKLSEGERGLIARLFHPGIMLLGRDDQDVLTFMRDLAILGW